MGNDDVIQMLNRAKNEITSMRGRLHVLEAREDVLETIAHVCGHRRNQPSIGMGEDIVWQIDKLVEHLRKQETAQTSKP